MLFLIIFLSRLLMTDKIERDPKEIEKERIEMEKDQKLVKLINECKRKEELKLKEERDKNRLERHKKKNITPRYR